ncbi:MAG: FG-GAP-like repeat-containing protein [Alcanivoracaceae bacterium]|nr:FG-GAP-like repeat-containing protein [Alcanivoracaceae bacterium]
MLLLAGCGGDSNTPDSSNGSSVPPITDPDPDPDPEPLTQLDIDLLSITDASGLTGDPAAKRNFSPVLPSEDPLVKLGEILFFSQSLAGGFDAACATCHLPDMGGSDGLSLPVGVVPEDRSVVGPGRRVDVTKDRDSLADGGPNMHRNSITTFNAALFDRAMMADGRIRVIDENVVPGGMGQRIINPESDPGHDLSGVDGLLAITSKFPITNNNEMRGYYYADVSNADDFRLHLVERLKGNVDQSYMARESAANWLRVFRDGFNSVGGAADELITLENIQLALGQYVQSQIFVDTPWRSYLKGSRSIISDEAKRGAILFFKSKADGGLGCAACHSGDRFTNEKYYNVGFPQIGRGFQRTDRTDVGRWLVTRDAADWYAQRVPSLLNIDLTAPYGHAGTFASLEEVIDYHIEPRTGFGNFDFTLQHLPQFINSGVTYPQAQTITIYAFEHQNFSDAQDMLPMRQLTTQERSELVAFLRSLTDRCAANVECRRQWVPAPEEDPDGHLLGADNGPAPVIDESVVTPGTFTAEVPLNWPTTPELNNFADLVACSNGTSSNLQTNTFKRRDTELGLTATHGFSVDTWSYGDRWINHEAAMSAGGVTSVYLNNDCWPDLLMTGGDDNGLVAYRSLGSNLGFVRDDGLLGGSELANSYARITGVGVADLNGDYRRELVLTNLFAGSTRILSAGAANTYDEIAKVKITRSTYGVSFADYDLDGYLDMVMGHWDGDGVDGTAPALWKGTGDLLTAWDDEAKLDSEWLDQKWNFTPLFVDFRNVRRMDLAISSDFGTSSLMQNNKVDGVHQYEKVTDRAVVTDENGMGGAAGDIDNDGKIDWFVTSIKDPNGKAEANWGVTGNRLYRNVSTLSSLEFEDITEQSGVRDGSWGWGVCMADFNNDGFLDIFHTNGFGYMPSILTDAGFGALVELYSSIAAEFIGVRPRLFINQGDGTFVDEAEAWGLNVASEGRGVTCFDYDRDGDVDIALLNNSTGMQFFENQRGSTPASAFLGIRLVGKSPNTDAIGARVYVSGNVGGGNGWQRQMRMSAANSNFNGQTIPDLHFGLGSATSASAVRIEWPDKSGMVCVGVPANQFLTFDQRDEVWPKYEAGQPLCTWYPDITQVAFDIFE